MLDTNNVAGLYPRRITYLCGFRHWHSRRVVITKEILAFAYIGDCNMLDYIPLREIAGVEHLEQDSEKSSKILFDKVVSVSNALQIQTIPDGYNSGRKYFLQTETEIERDQLASNLTRLVKIASTDLVSPHERRKILVKGIYNSNLVQGIAALLIILVRNAHQFKSF